MWHQRLQDAMLQSVCTWEVSLHGIRGILSEAVQSEVNAGILLRNKTCSLTTGKKQPQRSP